MRLTIIFNIKKPAINSMIIHYSVHCLAFCPIHLLQVFILCNVIGHFASIIVNIIIYAWLHTANWKSNVLSKFQAT